MFKKDIGLVTDTFTFTFAGETGKTYKILLTDILEGRWAVTKQGSASKIRGNVAAEENTFYFEGTAGTYTIEMLGDNPDGKLYVESNSSTSAGQTTVNVSLENQNTAENISGKALLAVYDVRGKLVKILIEDFSLAADTSDQLNFAFTSIPGAVTYKVICVNNLTSLAPLVGAPTNTLH